MELGYLAKASLQARGLLDEEKLAKAYGIRIVYEGSEDGLPARIEYLTKEEYDALEAECEALYGPRKEESDGQDI